MLLSIVLLVSLCTAYDPPSGRLNWFLEVGPGLVGIAVLVSLCRHFPMSHLAYWCVFLHMFILIYGGYYTYAETPLGNWVRDSLDLSRNHYDRVGHVALGIFPSFIVREVLLRQTPLQRGGWLYFIIISIEIACCIARAMGAIKVADSGNGRKMTVKNTMAPMSKDLVYNRSFSIPISVNVNTLFIMVRTKYPSNAWKIKIES